MEAVYGNFNHWKPFQPILLPHPFINLGFVSVSPNYLINNCYWELNGSEENTNILPVSIITRFLRLLYDFLQGVCNIIEWWWRQKLAIWIKGVVHGEVRTWKLYWIILVWLFLTSQILQSKAYRKFRNLWLKGIKWELKFQT